MDDKKEEKIIILGEEIDKGIFSQLYAWGKRNPVTLEKSIKRMLEKEGTKSIHDAMVALEKYQNFEEYLFITGHN